MSPKLGSGGFSRITIAELNGVAVARKRVVGQHAGNIEHARKVLDREVKFLTKIDHHNIVKLLGVNRHERFLLLELCDKTITTICGKVSFDRMREIANQLGSAIAYMHSNQIAHLDIKTENVLLKCDTIKVCDFNAAVSTTEAGIGDVDISTLAVVPPENVEVRFRSLTERNCFAHDVWSFGVTVYRLWVGRSPWANALPSNRRYTDWRLGRPSGATRNDVASLKHNDFFLKFLDDVLKVNPSDRPTIACLLDAFFK